MPRITLPDGSVRSYDQPIRAFDVASDISPRLAKSTLGARINGELSDINTLIEADAELKLITKKRKKGDSDPDALYLIRHSCAHVMAEAIQKIIPQAELVYGPPLENGFYYDIAFPEERGLSSADFEAIEKEMAAIIKEDRPFERYELPIQEGISKLEKEGSKFKLDNAQRAIEAGSDKLSWYATGTPNENWEDLCKGPHIPRTSNIGAFKVTSLAASYWHGDANSDKLTRVYGTAFESQKQLSAHFEQLEEAKRRDHRVVGKSLKLFHIDEMVGQGLILWTPNGGVIRRALEEFIRAELDKQGYDSVYTPHIGKLELYKTSGHFPYYQDSQYPPMIHGEHLNKMVEANCSCGDLSNQIQSGELMGYLLKPMNCPHHIRIYASQKRSYRELPIRLAEFGTVYRWEQSGELNGMTRVRGFTQDDAHLFCREEQIADEIRGCLELVKVIFSTLNMKDYRVRVGLRDPDGDKYVGSPEVWDRAEEACREAASSLDVPFSEEAGEAAFYGPKIDFIVKDIVGREWQLGTIQVDYNLPERFDLTYTGSDNKDHRPVMIHRAPFGSMERFVGVLIEHFAGYFPTWLSPEQVRVIPLNENSADYGYKVYNQLKSIGLRVKIDSSNNHIKTKIRNAADEKTPYMLVVGPRDEQEQAVSVRARGIPKNLGAIPLADFVKKIQEEVQQKSATLQVPTLFD